MTNGKRMFVEGDGRSPWARRRRDLQAAYAEDLGGPDLLTGFQIGLIQTAATLRVELEQLEGQMSTGRVVCLDKYGRLAGHYSRICKTLGLQRKQKDLVPDIREYAARHGNGDDDE